MPRLLSGVVGSDVADQMRCHQESALLQGRCQGVRASHAERLDTLSERSAKPHCFACYTPLLWFVSLDERGLVFMVLFCSLA